MSVLNKPDGLISAGQPTPTTWNCLAFTKGQRVVYTGLAHGRNGQRGTVIRPVKSRQVVTLTWDNDGSRFDARPENLAPEQPAS